jgi:hypothetical protein
MELANMANFQKYKMQSIRIVPLIAKDILLFKEF